MPLYERRECQRIQKERRDAWPGTMARRFADIRMMICFRKIWRRALVKTCSAYPAVDPNPSADSFEHDWPQSSIRVQSRLGLGMHINARKAEKELMTNVP